MLAVNAERYRYVYPGGERPALNLETFSVLEGEFALVVGGSGSGKSTLLRAIRGLVPLFHGGSASGRLELFGTRVGDCDPLSLARLAGMVFQDPESQVFMTRVEREVAFGLQNLGRPVGTIRRSVSEALYYLGIIHLKDAHVSDLSGGEKQKVALASVLSMRPRVLLLDEPTSQLDAVATEEFLGLVKRINEDFGTTVIMAEQRLGKCLHMADSVWLCDGGATTCLGTPKRAVRTLFERRIETPIVSRLFGEAGIDPLPLTIREGRTMIADSWARPASHAPSASNPHPGAASGPRPLRVELRGVSLYYDGPDGPCVGGVRPALSGVSLIVRKGEFVTILGENGAGKSTLLRVIAGITRPSHGRVRVWDGDGRVAWLSQNPNDHLTSDTVREEIAACSGGAGAPPGVSQYAPFDSSTEETLDALRLRPLMERNPRDLSSGERQRVAIAATLAGAPGLLLLDEPTRGMDFNAKRSLARLLRKRTAGGAAVVVVTHDVDMAADCGSRVIVMSRGAVVADGPPQYTLDGALFYSPQVNKLFRPWVEGVVAYDRALSLLREGWIHAV